MEALGFANECDTNLWLIWFFFFFSSTQSKASRKRRSGKKSPTVCSHTLNVFPKRKTTQQCECENPGILYNQVKLAVKARTWGKRGKIGRRENLIEKKKPRAQSWRNRGGEGGKQRQRWNMRHSCSLGLTYRAARDVTDGHVWHCANKQPVDSAANTYTLNPTLIWKHTAHWHIISGLFLWEACAENNPLQTLAYLFYVYICNPWPLHCMHIIIHSI